MVAAMTAERPFAVVPGPDAERVAAVRSELDPARRETFAAFADPARESLRSACSALMGDSAARTADEAAACLDEARATAAGLQPASLTPRTGLAGLFDGRGGRLKRFRASFQAADRRLAGLHEDLIGKVATLRRQAEQLEPRQEAMRGPIVELGAWLEAGRQRLAEISDDAPEGETSPRQDLAHRLERLAAGRMAALGQLPLARILQNADTLAADRLEAAANALAAWREDWRKTLGLDGRRPRKVQPEPSALSALTERLTATFDGARSALDEGRSRRARVSERLGELNRSLGEPPSV